MIVSMARLGDDLLERIKSATGREVISADKPERTSVYLPQAEIILSPGRIRREDLQLCGKLKWLHTLSAGVELLPFQELTEKGVIITNSSGIHATQMAEHALGMIIVFSRNLNGSFLNQRAHQWNRRIPVDELSGRTLCVIGAGSIGQETARKAKAFNMKVIGLKKRPEPLPCFDEVWGMERFHEALGLADYVLLLTPLTDETYHLMGVPEFAAMKENGVFINLSRGDTVDEPAMIQALQNGSIRGAGLDVFHTEPLEADNPLWNMENVMITPHNAGMTPYYNQRAVEQFLGFYEKYRAGLPLPNRVDPARKY